MSNWTIIAIIIIIIGYFVLKYYFANMRKSGRIKKYGEDFGSQINQRKISIGMSLEMVTEAFGSPAKSDGKTTRQNYVKEIFCYGAYQSTKNKTQYRYKVIFENDRVTEIHQI